MAIQVPLSWLKDFVAINITPDQLAERLTTAGLEVETIEKIGDNWGEYCVEVKSGRFENILMLTLCI